MTARTVVLTDLPTGGSPLAVISPCYISVPEGALRGPRACEAPTHLLRYLRSLALLVAHVASAGLLEAPGDPIYGVMVIPNCGV